MYYITNTVKLESQRGITMPNKHATGSRSTVIRCPNCGEDYSVTYKRCPFCDEKTAAPKKTPADPDEALEGREDEKERPAHSSGKRQFGGSSRRGSGNWSPPRVALTVVSLIVIAAAIWIVVTQIMPLVQRGERGKDPQTTPPAVTQGTTPPDNSAPPVGTDTPGVTMPPDAALTPEPTPAIPAGQTATGFTMNKSDVSLSRYGESFTLKITYIPAGSVGNVTFESDKPEVAVVGADGVVTGKSRGIANITATLPGGVTQTCIVRCKFDAPAGSGSSSQTSGGGSANTGDIKLNKTDFTFGSLTDPSVQMKVSGTSSTPVWSIGNSGVATISDSGVVKPVGPGTTTITCTVDGKTLECIVRCSF